MHIKPIGMRNIKTAISVMICMSLSYVFNREYIFYAVIASIIAMQSSVADSFKTGKNRMLGTVMGAVFGMIFAFISPGNIIFCGIGVIFIIYICDYLGWKKSVVISCIVFLGIMINLNGRSPVIYSMNRIIDTFIGIGVAVIINYFISPPKHGNKLHREYILTLDRVFIIVEDRFCLNNFLDLKSLDTEIKKLEEALKLYVSEFRINKIEYSVEKIKIMLDVFKEIYMHMKIIDSLENINVLNNENKQKLEKLFKRTLEQKSISKVSNEIDIVFNYHVHKILENLYILKSN
ncbi:FUSC family protein [Clostridium tyrobutyricum]|uniref:FUSC family protein n=1 Tax=Clostridium tyrobutyricum TaxID=1519 RepID=UPI001C382F02|nr:aromatic acid exporter family protein [Clostridium tyrobutyricum]MBV4415335.1 FUSC family protein [Clostridium tyrobutyricum]